MSTLKRLHHIDQEIKFIVCGYIRSEHESLFRANACILFQNVPNSITSLCTLYYYLYDYFDLIGSDMKISNDKKTITYNSFTRDWPNANYGKNIISSTDKCIYKWYLKIRKRENIIVSVVSNKNCNPHLYPVHHDKYYWFFLNPDNLGKLKDHKGSTWQNPEYGKDIKNGDIVCMELNLKRENISFYINGKNLGVAFQNIDIGDDIDYRLCVTLRDLGSFVTIMKFTQHS